MDGTNPKVSFIPKGSLVHQDSFLERSRPRSVIGILAIIAFVLSVGSYAGLFYYNDSLNQIVDAKTEEIEKVKKEFSDAPEVEEAKIFRARADLARELLNAHTVATPVFEFLSKNTTESILFNRFSFKNDATGSALSLSGEAENYASLAFQVDVLRGKTTELAGLSVGDVTLTEYGTINFTLTMVFKPEYLLYTKYINNKESSELNSISTPSTPSTPSSPSSSFAPTLNFDITPTPKATTTPVPPSQTTPVVPVTSPEPAGASSSSGSAGSVVIPDIENLPFESSPASSEMTTTSQEVGVTSTSEVVPPMGGEDQGDGKQSFLKLFWSKFKFW